MKTLATLFFLLFTIMTTTAQTVSDFDRIDNDYEGKVIYKGTCTAADLSAEKDFQWFAAGVASYKPDTAATATLRKLLGGCELIVLMGTWCEDSQNLVPKFFKTLTEANYKWENVTMYALDRAKEGKYIEHKAYQVDRVPTFIVMKDHKEIGRIVESVQKSIEKDLVAVLAK